MKSDGERFTPTMGLQIALEHWHRYRLALGHVSGKIVLDVACGEGYGSALLAERAQQVIAVDIDQETIDAASEKYIQANLKFSRCNATELPLSDSSVEVVVSFETIEHLTQSEQHLFLAEVSRVLTPDGLLIISSPDRVSYSEARGLHNPFHRHELTSDEFQASLVERFPYVEIAKQRTGFLSLVTSQNSLESFSIRERADGTFICSDEKLTFDYSIALCSKHELPEQALGESVNFDTRLLTDVIDPITKKLLAASAVAEERAVEIASLIEAVEEGKRRWYLQSGSASRITEQSLDEPLTTEKIAALHENEKTILRYQLAMATTASEERAVEVAMLLSLREREIAALRQQLALASAETQERLSSMTLALHSRERSYDDVLEKFRSASALAEERGREIASLLEKASTERSELERLYVSASALAHERAEQIAAMIEAIERERVSLQLEISSLSILLDERANELAAVTKKFEQQNSELEKERVLVSALADERASKLLEVTEIFGRKISELEKDRAHFSSLCDEQAAEVENLRGLLESEKIENENLKSRLSSGFMKNITSRFK
ncbi:Methyltransferase domain-containing protein [Rhizobium sp. RU33A]|uniref:class I SAM-dependent methyltransferase n=1 Tax=Rhizobium sp. RU33A TaxID=1907413 RepID=UPI0009575352|nr:class I SAM-dependent methyltransferase [Rhizobium sp. RU33A]SIR13278.1 Methyltransferase domain-containing protein [Rhizobium sp. RU33A]